ncbi:hypothetical protein [Collimonas antrihumi]|uniref:hypothetical protein n=1 Tax=Collimonas antrihumi TaxID=1940615 RepID=UPI001B8D68EE|nr:hypothetical protein [Collimonas antrihumi]
MQQASNTRFPYRIVTLVRSADSAAIKDLLRVCLQDGLAQYDCYQRSVSRFLSRITIELLCSVSERAALVRLVNRLGLEKGVRNVHWESITEKSLLASPGNALEDRRRPDSSALSPAVGNHELVAVPARL